MDEMGSEAHLSEDKAKKAMVDAARLADELRAEQDHTRFTIKTAAKNTFHDLLCQGPRQGQESS